jgi:general secretion pathway protein K
MNPDSRMKRLKYSGILNLRHWLGNSEGMVLVLTLMILTLITAMVVEFAYGVYTSTSALYNWRDSQRLSFVAKSGVVMAEKILSDPQTPQSESYKYLGREIPVPNIPEGFNGSFVIRAEDENAGLNLNSIHRTWGDRTLKVYDSLQRLLRDLDLDETIADRVADWIDTDSEPRLRDSEEGAKNAFMESVDELLLIQGIDQKAYEKLAPYVTVYGFDGPDSPLVNINTAPIPVIMSLDERITREMAEALLNQRVLEPFALPGQLEKIGFSNAMISSISDRFTVTFPRNFRITSVAEENKIKRIIEGVVKVTRGGQGIILSWRER